MAVEITQDARNVAACVLPVREPVLLGGGGHDSVDSRKAVCDAENHLSSIVLRIGSPSQLNFGLCPPGRNCLLGYFALPFRAEPLCSRLTALQAAQAPKYSS